MWQLEKHWGDFLGGHGQPRRLGEDRPGLCGLVAKAMLSPTPQPRLLPFPSLSILKGEEGREGKEGRVHLEGGGDLRCAEQSASAVSIGMTPVRQDQDR